MNLLHGDDEAGGAASGTPTTAELRIVGVLAQVVKGLMLFADYLGVGGWGDQPH